VCRDSELTLLTDAHTLETVVPALDDLAHSELQGQRGSSVKTRVELLAICKQSSSLFGPLARSQSAQESETHVVDFEVVTSLGLDAAVLWGVQHVNDEVIGRLSGEGSTGKEQGGNNGNDTHDGH
jgi:hypothetical protein